MAVGSTTNFNETRNELVIASLQTAGILGLEQPVISSVLDYGVDMLNRMIKHWETQGIHLWRRQTAEVFLTPSTYQYSLGTTNWHGSDTIVRTTISADEALGQTILSVTSGSDFTAADNIGIQLDDGTMQWTTVASATSTTVTVDDSLTAAAASGNQVYAYTTRLERPMRIESAQLRKKDLLDRPLNILQREDYLELPNKSTSGTPSSIYYDPRRDTYGTLYVYEAPPNCTDTILIDYLRTIKDFDASTDNMDLPQEWHLAVVWNLAVLLCPAHGKDKKAEALRPEANRLLGEALAYDKEMAPFSITNHGNDF